MTRGRALENVVLCNGRPDRKRKSAAGGGAAKAPDSPVAGSATEQQWHVDAPLPDFHDRRGGVNRWARIAQENAQLKILLAPHRATQALQAAARRKKN